MLEEQDEMKREVSRLRGLVEERRRSLEDDDEVHSTPLESVAEEEEEAEDDDDTRSIVTITPGSSEDEEERKERGEEVEKDRPRTPEPSAALDVPSSGTIRAKSKGALVARKTNEDVQAQLRKLEEQVKALENAEAKVEKMDSVQQWAARVDSAEKRIENVEAISSQLSSDTLVALTSIPTTTLSSLSSIPSTTFDSLSKFHTLEKLGALEKLEKLGALETLAEKLESVVKLTSALEEQHAQAQSVIKGLEGKVSALEGLLRAKVRFVFPVFAFRRRPSTTDANERCTGRRKARSGDTESRRKRERDGSRARVDEERGWKMGVGAE